MERVLVLGASCLMLFGEDQNEKKLGKLKTLVSMHLDYLSPRTARPSIASYGNPIAIIATKGID